MPQRILDPALLEKLSKKLVRPIAAVRVAVSKSAAKKHISSEAALAVMAKQHKIGTAHYERKLDPSKRAEIRDAFNSDDVPLPKLRKSKNTQPNVNRVSEKRMLRYAIDRLISDKELRRRCRDILLAPTDFDRAINQATLVLEDRIRKKAKPKERLVGDNLIGFAFNADIQKTVLAVASDDPDDQRGMTRILQGIFPAFRNITHHHIVEKFSREDAIRICGFIDLLLRAVDNSITKKQS